MIPTSRAMAGPFVAKRRNRRWMVGIYWGMMVPLTAFVVGRVFARQPSEWFMLIAAAVMVLNLFTLSRLGTKPFFPAPMLIDREMVAFWNGKEDLARLDADLRLDERETQLRDRAHFRAYGILVWFALGWFGMLCVSRMLEPAWSAWTGPVFLSVLIAVLLGLPQTLLAWNEPDVNPTGEEE